MSRAQRKFAAHFAFGWAALGTAIALSGMRNNTAANRIILGAFTAVALLACVGAAVAVLSDRLALSGLLLIVSAVMPTYFGFILNLLAIAVGIWLFVQAYRRRRRVGTGARDLTPSLSPAAMSAEVGG